MSPRRIVTLLILSLFCLPAVLQAQSPASSPANTNDQPSHFLNAASEEAEPDSSANPAFGRFGYPYAYYTPETQLAIGLGGIVYFRSEDFLQGKPSKVLASAYYTSNQQYSISLIPQFYFKEDIHFVSADLYFGRVVDKFYGIGNSTPDHQDVNYDALSAMADLKYTWKITEEQSLGLNYKFGNYNITKTSDNYILSDSSVLGDKGGLVSGGGMNFSIDTRDYIFYPTRGIWFEGSAQLYPQIIMGDYKFGRYVADARWYTSTAEDVVLAVQAYGAFSSGSPPFYELPALGGSSRMRGYFKGRFRDRQYVMGQVELRRQFAGQFGIVLFGGVGEVMPHMGDFTLTGLKYSFGGGIRFMLDEKEKMNIRVDYGMGENTNGVYFAIEEAF